MFKWVLEDIDGIEFHIYPEDDMKTHVTDFQCSCGILINFYDDSFVVQHNSFDNREITEGKKDV